jgi:hypothetical protein
MRKRVALLVIASLTVSSLLMGNFEPASAQSKPSVPEFTISYVDNSYDVSPKTTSTTDPYTNETTTTTAQGYHVNKVSIEAVIKNNLGASYYNFRYKGHYSGGWSYYPSDPDTISGYNHYDDYFVSYPASDSDYTVIALDFLPTILGRGEVDIQVQALFGDYNAVPYVHPFVLPAPTYDFYFEGTTSDWSETVTFTYDITPPEISILFPQKQDYFTSDVDLTFLADEPLNQIAYILDGGEKTLILGNTTLTGLSDGTHNVTVYGWDSVGNEGTSTTLTFEVKSALLTEIIVIATVVSIVLVGIGLLLYFKKRKREAEQS